MSEPATQPAPDLDRTHSFADTSDTSAADSETAATLDARYGTSRRKGFDRRFAWTAAVTLVAAGVAFLAFSGWQQGSNIEFQDIGFDVVNSQQVNVRFDVTAPPMSEVACAVEALSPSKGTVGWKIVSLPVTETRSHSVSTSVVTTSESVTGSVRSCWTITG